MVSARTLCGNVGVKRLPCYVAGVHVGSIIRGCLEHLPLSWMLCDLAQDVMNNDYEGRPVRFICLTPSQGVPGGPNTDHS